MKTMTVWFDLVSPDTAAWFARWPQAIEGHSVSVDWQPVAAADGSAQAPWLRLLLACAAPGGTPSRWACEQVLRRGADDTPASVASRLRPLRRADGDDITAELDAAARRAAIAGATSFPAVWTDGVAHSGLAGLACFAAPSESP